jgi:hypothetical protein
LAELKLKSRDFNFASLSNKEIKTEIESLKRDIDNFRKQKLQFQHNKNLRIDLHHRARMDREICIYLLNMARNSTNKKIRKEGKRLLNLIKGL